MSEPAALVTIVVLTYNRCTEVLRTLAMLTAVEKRAAIVVVDNASSDGTPEAIARHFPQVTLVRLRFNLGAAGRNYGVAVAGTPYVAFCDDDTWWECGAIARAVEILRTHAELALVCARILVGERERLDATSNRMANSPLRARGLPGRAILGFMAGASVMRVAAFRAVGGYNVRLFLGCEEELMALDFAASGWQMLYCDEVIVHHFPSPRRAVRAREAITARNAVWVACLRLPWREVAYRMRTLLQLRNSRGAALWQTARGLLWALAHRRRIPRSVERMRQCLLTQKSVVDSPRRPVLIQRSRDR